MNSFVNKLRVRLSNDSTFSPWIILLAVIAWWHSWRGVEADVWIHGVVAAILFLDAFGLNLIKPHRRRMLSARSGYVLAAALFIPLTFTPRHGVVDKVVLGILAAFCLYYVWTDDNVTNQREIPLLRHTNKVWWYVIVAFLIVECSAFMLASSDHGNDEMYPALSVLLNPFLNETFSRGILVALWLLLGFKLLRIPVRK